MKSIFYLFFLSCFIFSSQFSFSQENTYTTAERLFHVERSKNKNIVCYDVNLTSEGKWNSSEPVEIYWVNREETPGKTNGLSGIQKKLAYGYKLRSHNKDSCTITLNACSDKPITIKRSNQKFSCIMTIGNVQAELNKVYVQAGKHNSLKVEFVELYGTALVSGKPISERIKN